MTKALKITLPVLVLSLAALSTWVMVNSRPRQEVQPSSPPPPLVRDITVKATDHTMKVHAQGTVSPRTEIVISSEVSGKVDSISPSLTAGGFFELDEVLLTIEPRDFELAVTRAKADVARAELKLIQEEAEAEVAKKEWKDLGKGRKATPLALHAPQVAEARAVLESAHSGLEQAQRDLEKTKLRAPFSGRVREKMVDIGQFVSRGNTLALLYGVDFAEVRLPLADKQLAYLDLPLDYRGEERSQDGPRVILRAQFAGRLQEWEGKIVRTEGEIDPRSRMIHAVARVSNPYGRGENHDRPPLAVGLFVKAEIFGRFMKNIVILPRAALREDGRVLVIDSENRLHFRNVDLLRTSRERITIRSGVKNGERVCISNLAAVVENMRVRTEADNSSGDIEPRGALNPVEKTP